MSPSDKPTRREFIVTTSSAAVGITVPLSKIGAAPDPSQGHPDSGGVSFSRENLFESGPQRTFHGDRLTQIALPIGGIGAGCVCFNGYGGLQDFSIGNRPATTAQPEGFAASKAAFAVLHIKGKSPVTRLVEGPFPALKIYDQGLQGEGYRRGGFEGFPRFESCTFTGEYPFGHVKLTDSAIPLAVTVTAWNPFIPLDDKNSSLPVALLEYALRNTSTRTVDYQFSYHLSHLAPGCGSDDANGRNKVIPDQGVLFYNIEKENAEGFGSACLMALEVKPRIKGMWLRSPGWEFDSLSALWRDTKGRNGGSVLLEGSLAPGETRTHPILIAWHFPNCYLQVGGKESEVPGTAGCRTLAEGAPPPWRPYYAGMWHDAHSVATYVAEHYPSLRNRTTAFKDALFASTLPPYVLDAVSANLGIMKSPTVLRLENGDIWGWEGCFTDAGCCHGSCTHVWNYAQAFPHLYPNLERSLRDLELNRSMDERGHVTFRSALPEGPVKHDFHAASDGQLGGIMKVFRDWQISGDSEWLKKMYPLAKKSLDYCIRTWDPDARGGLFEPHHNTYDIEFWGPDGMCTSIYLGALSAFGEMAEAIGQAEDAKHYRDLAHAVRNSWISTYSTESTTSRKFSTTVCAIIPSPIWSPRSTIKAARCRDC
jgi:beta-glucosidase 2, glycosyl-hydrolase family 116 N-term/Glycosyl-hydrolase family 116, catalytic region